MKEYLQEKIANYDNNQGHHNDNQHENYYTHKYSQSDTYEYLPREEKKAKSKILVILYIIGFFLVIRFCIKNM